MILPRARIIAAVVLTLILLPVPALAQVSPPKPTPEVLALLENARKERRAGHIAAAEPLYVRALDVAVRARDRKGETDALYGLGLVHSAGGDNRRALDDYRRSLGIAREIGDTAREGAVLTNIAAVQIEAGDVHIAVTNLHQALPLLRIDGRKPAIAFALNNLGAAISRLGNWREALRYYTEARAIHAESGDRVSEAQVLRNIGEARASIGQMEEALKDFDVSLAICRAAGEKGEEGLTLLSQAVTLDAMGQRRKALEKYVAALTIARETKSASAEAIALNNIACLYDSVDQPEIALDDYRRARELFEAVGARANAAYSLNNMGGDYAEMGRTREAIEASEAARRLFDQMGDTRGSGGASLFIGKVYNRANEPARALEPLRRAVRLLGRSRYGGEAMIELGRGYQTLGRTGEALEMYRSALSVGRELGLPALQADALRGMGDLEMHRGRTRRAAGFYEAAVSLVERMRASLGDLSAARSTYLRSRIQLYRNAVRARLAMGDTAGAFSLAQRAKARGLLDLLATGRIQIAQGLTDEERKRLQELRATADSLNLKMVQEGVENETGSRKRYALLRDQLRIVERDLQSFTETLCARRPEFATKSAAAPVTVQDLRRLLPAGSALLEYVALSENRTALFVAARKGDGVAVRSFILPAGTRALAPAAVAFRSACADPRRAYRAEARSLYRRLIGPAESAIRGAKHLVVCPDGPLWDVPFQALILDRHDRFLGERCQVSYAASASAADAADRLASHRQPRSGASLLIAANPDFGSSERFGDLSDVPGQRPIDSASRPLDSASRPLDAASRPLDSASRPIDLASRALDTVSRGATRGKAIPSLPGTQREADALRKLFPDATVLTGDKAQESTVRQLAGKYRYLHFATHGFVNDGSPLLSSVVLAKPNDNEDGFLTAREIYDLNLNAEMTVLSACNTARGENRTGEGVIGLTWALFVAGCPTQVVSQWAVDDQSTAMLMGRFYENLKVRGMGKAAALQEAESWLRKQNPKYQHPYYWAPFVLNGAWK